MPSYFSKIITKEYLLQLLKKNLFYEANKISH